MTATGWSPEPAIEFKGIFVHPDHLASMAPSPSSSISSALTCLDFSDEDLDGDYNMGTLALDSPVTVVGEDDCDDYFTFGSPKYSPKTIPSMLASSSTSSTPTTESVSAATRAPLAQSMSRVASSSTSTSRGSPALVRTPSLYGNENAAPSHFPASLPFSMFLPQPTYDAFSPAPASPSAFPASCFFASRPPSPSAGSPPVRPSPYSRKNSVASLKASNGGESMVRCVSSPVETMSQVTQRRAALSAMTNTIDLSASQMARSRSVAAGAAVGSASLSSSLGMTRSSIGLGVGGVQMARSPKQRGTPYGDNWGAALPPREVEPTPAPVPFPYNVERTKPAPPTRLVRAYSMVNTLTATENVAPVASPVLGQNRPRRPTLLAPLTPIIPGGSAMEAAHDAQGAAAFAQAVARTAASPRMALQRGRSIC